MPFYRFNGRGANVSEGLSEPFWLQLKGDPALQIFPGSVDKVAFGKFSAKNFETAGGFIPAVPTRTGVPAVQSTGDVYFNLFIPAGTRPANGWPVAIFAHGFGNNKNSSPFAVASTLAHNGIATLSINSVGRPHHLVADEPPFDDVDDRHVTEGDVVRSGRRCEEHQSQSECSGEISHLTYFHGLRVVEAP